MQGKMDFLKDKIARIANSFVFYDITEKNPVSTNSFLLLAQAINQNIYSKSNILISLQGFSQSQYISKFAKFLQYSGHTIYEFDTPTSTPFMVDEYAMKLHKLDYLFKITVDSTNSLVRVHLYNKDLKPLNSESLNNIYQIYIQNKPFNFKFSAQPLVRLDFERYVNILAGKEEILKPFVDIKPRYKTMSLLTHRNQQALKIMRKILTNYANEYRIKNRKISVKRLKIRLKLFKKTYSKLGITNVIHFDEINHMNSFFFVNNRYRFLDYHTLALVYLDFYLQEYKRAKFEVQKFKVLIPFDAPYRIKELLKQYSVQYSYFDENTYKDLLLDKSYVFAYNSQGFIANPKYSTEINNYYFFACLIWMLNSYANRNNLLNFKLEQIEQQFGRIKTITRTKKIKMYNNIALIRFCNYLAKQGNNKQFQHKIIGCWEGNRFYLFSASNEKKHQIIFYYDFEKLELKAEIRFCMSYKYKNHFSVFDWVKALKYIQKTFSNFKIFIDKKIAK
ncbi:hypothetical protein MCAL160_0679 [Mycoplasmopsis californica HAZ160_1]|uniref:Uncharacterized protein n=1 Tax=Mycoplasmopsis californica HAZ160_1 TaxID=1397850 RepID=A0AAT9F8D3_9BACT|nr:hypothetical protein [Mycoplasmopsis californica]BAP01145.1 hypothetical protein MCAL160_0679 [Mycoplasmopsis californica HAZ160_1]BBG41011.1 hypothetical protein MCAL106_0679 [Mycoplasmopsis californica]BBG41604.1 hypothetical protein MCAL106E_0679 [Mycoplasmopsis californica]BBG42198.1 hypothetical protein MCAL106L_0679 [Mycoplasmopsis californica]BBG42780.1 hypothetical protein MCAL160E_0679 [Mycoplasmopsis californica]